MSARRHRRQPLQHLLVLCALLMATLAQPVLASVAEVHEAVHPLVDHGRHQHAFGDASDAGQDDRGQGEERSLLHALASANHCCGHAVAITTTLPRLPAALAAGDVVFAVPADPAGRLIGGLFRPPIRI
ncbi:hypothetical protein [Pseudoxanthomonas dokdonensis]|uniref:hypothetical protein n=1 Tax=Pseudoxanthomonas dokdonensis TaxID=344882 RepID=UPI0012EDB420|nr:hypothetical protein [Pseudoxanthomonas dokdonensis]